MLRLIGAGLILLACGCFGFSLAAGYRKEETALHQIIGALEYMEWELQYRLTPLPELCRRTGNQAHGMVKHIFLALAEELEQQMLPDAASCMDTVLSQNTNLSGKVRSVLHDLGSCLGCFDLPGQLQGLSSCRQRCMEELCLLQTNKENRLRSYQMLGVCTGLALAILLI